MRAEHFELKKIILNILDKWHEYFDVVESHFWCEKSGTKEQNTKSINVGILCVYQYRFISKFLAKNRPGVDKVKPKVWFKYSLKIDYYEQC